MFIFCCIDGIYSIDQIQIVFQAFAALIFLQLTMRLCKISDHLPPSMLPPHTQAPDNLWAAAGVECLGSTDRSSVTQNPSPTATKFTAMPHILLDTQSATMPQCHSATDCHNLTFYLIHRVPHYCHSATFYMIHRLSYHSATVQVRFTKTKICQSRLKFSRYLSLQYESDSTELANVLKMGMQKICESCEWSL